MSMDLLANIAATILGTDNQTKASRTKRKRKDELVPYFATPNSSSGDTETTTKFSGVGKRCRLWSTHEFFYSTIDNDYFAENEFIACLDLVGLGNIKTLTKAEWSVVRGFMGSEIGRPRRLSRAFLEAERIKLNEYRGSVRQYQKMSSSSPEFSIPQPISVGQRVAVIERRHKTVKTGVVLSIVSSPNISESASYLVQFDNAEVESTFFNDTELRVITSPKPPLAMAMSQLSSDSRMNSLTRNNSSQSGMPVTRKNSVPGGGSVKISRSFSRDSNCASDLNSEEDGYGNERRPFEMKLFSQLSQLSQLSQQSNFIIGDSQECVNEDSQVSDVTFFKIPTLKLTLLQTKSVIDTAFSEAEDQAKLLISRCLETNVAFVGLQSIFPQLYQLVFRCVSCMLVLQNFPLDKLDTDIGSILLAVALKVCSEDDTMSNLDPERLQIVLSGLTSLCGAVCQYPSK